MKKFLQPLAGLPNLSSIAESFERIGRKCASIALSWDKST